MKTKIKRHSRAVISVILTLCMLMSCMTVGLIATDAAQSTDEVIGDTATWTNFYMFGSVVSPANWTASDADEDGMGIQFNASGDAYYIATSTTTVYFRIMRNDFDGGYDFAPTSDSNTTVTVDGSTEHHANAQGYTGRSFAMSVTNNHKYQIHINSYWNRYGDGSTAGNRIFFTATDNGLISTPLAAPSITATPSGGSASASATQNIKASTGQVTLNWAAVDHATGYDVYKGNSKVTSVNTNSYSFNQLTSNTGSYTVKATSTDAAYTESSASNAIQINITKTALDAPALKCDNATGTVTYDAAAGDVSFTWGNITNAGSYTIYKNDAVLASNVTSPYTVPKLESSSGTYKLVANPSNTNTHTASTSNEITLTISKQTLATPQNVTLSKNSITIPPTENITLFWSSVTNAASYKVYKDNVEFDTVNSTSTTILSSFVNAGTYTVVAFPSAENENYYNHSETSAGATLAVNKTPVDAPQLTLNGGTADVTGDVGTQITAKIENYAALSDKLDFALYRGTSSDATNTKVADFTGATLAFTPNASTADYDGLDTYYTVEATLKAAAADSYTLPSANEKSNSVKTTLTKAVWSLCGQVNRISESSESEDWSKASTYEISTYVKPGVYRLDLTIGDSDNAYLGLWDGNRHSLVGYTTSGNDYTVPDDGLPEKQAIGISAQTSDGSFKLTKSKTYTIYVDQINNKAWFDGENVTLTPVAYYQNYDENGTFVTTTPQAGNTGGTVSAASTVARGSAASVTATPASGYVFDGWYDSTDFENNLSTNATYEPELNSSVTYYALFKKATYPVTVVAADNNGTVEANSVNSGSVPVLLPTATADPGYVFLNWTTSDSTLTLRNETSADGATVAATGAGTVTANFAPAVAAAAQVKGDGVGTVTVNGVENSNNVPQGGQVSFVATPGDNCSFYGWFTTPECTPESRVSTSRTFTTTVNSAVTYYALINFSNHKLWGNGALLHWGDGKADLGDANITFTQSSSDARIYNVKVDMKRTTYVAVSVDPGSPNTYEAAEDGNDSGTAASATRVDYDTDSTKKWKVLDETDVKGLNFEWNALTKTLSWTETAIDPNEYTVVYVKELTDSNNAYVWSGDTKVFGNYPGAALYTFPEVKIGDDKYRVIYLTKDSVGDYDTFSVNINKGEANTGTDFTNLEIGKSYTVARTNSGSGTDSGTPVVTHEGLTARTLTVTVPKVNRDTVATAYISKVNGVATTGKPTSLNTVYRGDDIQITYEFAEGMEPNYDYKDTTGVTGATESSKVISFQMPNEDTVAKVNFVEYDDTIYISDKAGWGSIKLHIWNNDNDTTWDTWDSEPIMSKSTDTWTTLAYNEGHNVRYKYDADKELYLVKGLSQSKGSMANFIIRKSDGTARTANITDTEIGALYKTIGDEGDAHYKSAENFDYDTYDPYEVAWPPEDVSAYSADSTMYLRYSNNDQFNTTGNNKADGIVVKKDSGNTGYWIDLTDLLLNDLDWGNFYFFLTSNNASSGIQGNENNYLIDADDSGNYTGKQSDESTKTSLNLPSSGTKLLGAEIKQNGTVHNTTKYGSFNNIDRTKLTHVGLFMQNIDGKIMYKVYYTGGGSPAKSKTVKVYAKDSTLRSGYSIYNAQATTNLTDSEYATTTPKYYDGESGTAYTVTRYNDDYDYTPAVPKGTTIYFKTQMANGALDSGVTNDYFNTDYYLKGYSINGTVYQLHTGTGDEADGLYKESFTIPEDWPYDYVEITPIYWRRNTDNTMVFYVQGYTDEVRNAGWGNTIGVYPFYQDEFNVAAKGSQNAYGGYPGQPLVNYKGDLFAQIPVEYEGTNENNVQKTMYIKGVTMSNMFWDYVHLATGEVDKHHQTYDYDDLYKIYQEEIHEGTAPDNIICSFKYENKHNNDEPSLLTVTEAGLAVYSNGWEDLVNFSGKKVDIFGTELTTAGQSKSPLYVISQDYRSNCAGKYATEWAVYDETGTKVTTIVPSALILKDEDRFNEYDAETLKFKDEYQTLNTSTYKDRPVLITYEQSIWGGSDQAERCDARWYFSRNNDEISATLKIQISEDNGKTWTDATGLTDLGTCDIAGIRAVFDDGTRASASDLIHTKTLKINKEAYYKFTADESEDYKFDSWQVVRDGAMQQVTNKLGDNEEIAPLSGNAEFIARFKHVVNNKFSLYHEIHPQSAGVGTVDIAAQKYATGTAIDNVATAVGEEKTGTSVSFDISNDETNVILATFTATPRADSTFENFYETVSTILTDKYGNKLDYILDFEIDAENNQFKVLYDIDKLYSGTTLKVSSETFYSRFGFKEREYKIDYYFNTRAYGKKVYTVTGTITSEDASNNFKDQLSTDIGFSTLNAAFVLSKAPTESNYGEDLRWNSTDVNILPDEGTVLRAKIVADQKAYDLCRAKIVDGNVTKILETTYGNHFLDGIAEYRAQNPATFSYWKVYKYKGGSGTEEIARCYGLDFNYTAYEDYYVEAVYGENTGISRQAAYEAREQGYASLLSISRNHWNRNAKEVEGVWQINDEDGNTNGSTGYNKANTEYDRLYIDFVLGYDYKGIDLSKTSGYTMQYKVEKFVGEGATTAKATSYKTVAKVDNKNRVHCTLGVANSEETADYFTVFKITPILKQGGTEIALTSNTIEVKLNSIANSDREWVE